MPATTITGMNTVILPSDSGWDPEQVLATITSAVSRAGGAEPTSVTIPIDVLPVATPTTLGITMQPLTTVFGTVGSATWTKRASTQVVQVLVVGGGGGGGFGGTYAAVGGGSGGGGGGGAGWQVATVRASDVGTTETIIVGAGGSAGTAGTPVGGIGGISSFGTKFYGGGGGGGASGGAAVEAPTTMANPLQEQIWQAAPR